MAESLHQTFPTGEVPPEDFERILAGGLNHEAKLAILGIMGNEPDQWFTKRTLHEELRERQGAEPGWVPDSNNPIKICEKSLAPSGLLIAGTIQTPSGVQQAFKANHDAPELFELGLRAAGAEAEWSLLPEAEKLSLQRILGTTSDLGSYPVPVLRYKVLKAVVEADTDLTMKQISDKIADGNISNQAAWNGITDLSRCEVLDSYVLDNAVDTTLAIDVFDFRDIEPRMKGLKLTSQYFFTAIKELRASGHSVITFGQLQEVVSKLDPTFDLSKLRNNWSRAISAKPHTKTGFKAAERLSEDPEIHSIVTLRRSNADATVDLVARLYGIELALPGTSEYAKVATDLIKDPVKLSALMAKAKNNSASYQATQIGSAGMAKRIIGIVAEIGNPTIGEVTKALLESNISVTDETVAAHLRKLASEGVLDPDTKQKDLTKKRRYRSYKLARIA